MNKFAGKEEFHDIYPEFNPARERMIRHKERSGATAKGLLAAALLTALTGLMAAAALVKDAVIQPTLLSVTETSAQVEVQSSLQDSDIQYPLDYLLLPYPSGSQEKPVDSAGRLTLSPEEVEALGEPALRGQIRSPEERLLFESLNNASDYLLLFRTQNEGEPTLRREALYIPMVRHGRPAVSDGPTKAPSVVEITPSPTPTPTATPTATPTPTSSASPMEILVSPGPTGTPTATPVPYIPPVPSTPTPTPTPIVRHTVTVVLLPDDQDRGNEGYVGTAPNPTSVGPITVNKGQHVYIGGSTTNIDEEVYAYRSWELVSGTPQGMLGSGGFIMGNDDVTVQVNFARLYQIYADEVDSATGSYSLSGTTGFEGDTVSFSATPAAGYTFDSRRGYGWGFEGTNTYTSNSVTFEDSDIWMWFQFDLEAYYAVTTGVSPDGSGTCSITGSDLNGSDGSYTCLAGREVTVTATAASTSDVTFKFSHFMVNGSEYSDNPYTFDVDSDTTITAVFKPAHTLHISNDTPDEWGTTTPYGDVLLAEGESVQISCVPATGYIFTHAETMSDHETFTSSPFTYTMGTANESIVCAYTPIPRYPVVVHTSPEGSGSYTLSPYDSEHENYYELGTVVTVTAVPNTDEGWAFDHMTIDGVDYEESSHSVTVGTAGVDVYIYYKRATYSINTSVVPAGAGSIYITPGDNPAEWGTTISIEFDLDDEAYEFDYFTINGTRYEDPETTYTVTSDTTIIAHCVGVGPFYISAYASPAEGGSVSVYPSTTANPGDAISVSYTTNPGYEFDSWSYSGGVTSPTETSDSLSFTMGEADASVTANFKLINYSITVSPNGGTVTSNPGSATMGTTVTVTIVSPDPGPNATALLSNWSVSGATDATHSTSTTDDGVTTATITFTMPAQDVTVSVTWTIVT